VYAETSRRGRCLRAASAAAAELGSRPPLVLVVEDEPTQRQMFELVLAPHCSLALAATGAEALRIAGRLGPDLILMDVMLPDANGLELTRRLKRSPRLTNVPVVMITGRSERTVVLDSVEAGAVDFLVKPVSARALVRKVERYVGSPATPGGTGPSGAVAAAGR
jgi:CheY-like chemotaxis protein